MSGGSWDYVYSRVQDVAEKLVEGYDEDGRKLETPYSAKRQALGELMLLVANALHEIEWEDSGDGGNEEAALDAVFAWRRKED